MAKVSQITLPSGTTYDIGASTQNITLRDYENGTSDVAMFPVVDRVRANRLAFLPADQIIIEKTTDGGTTWESAGIPEATKAALFGPASTSINIPLLDGKKSELCGLRITITGMKYNVPSGTSETNKYDYWNSTYINKQERYFQLERLWFWISSNDDSISLKVEAATGAKPNNWSVRFNKDWGMTGWSGSDWAKVSSGKFGGGTTQTGNYWNWRLTFFSRKNDGDTAFRSNNVQAIQNIRGYGANVWGAPNKLMYHDHLYDIDVNQNAAFPAKVTATGGFVGDLTGSASKVNNHTVESDVPANAKFTDTTYTAASASPKMDGTAAVGTSAKYAREDHVHPTDTSRVPTSRKVNNKALSADITLSASDVSAIATSAKGAANGVAELDANGKVPSSQLPSYVDDVLEYSSKSSFPTTGETGKIYVDTGTNLTYRWSGSAYVEISPSLALGETSSTAYRGDYGKAAYAHAVTNKGSAFSSGLYKITTNSEGHVTAATAVAKADITALGIPGSDTDTKVTNTLATTTKYYVTGTTSASTNTGTQSFDSGIYATTTAGELNATQYKLNEKAQIKWNATDSSIDFVFV